LSTANCVRANACPPSRNSACEPLDRRHVFEVGELIELPAFHTALAAAFWKPDHGGDRAATVRVNNERALA
jgi:hypothetical protein